MNQGRLSDLENRKQKLGKLKAETQKEEKPNSAFFRKLCGQNRMEKRT
jgi:hypothetical protein